MFVPITINLSQLVGDVSLSGVARGDILYRGVSKWNNLAPGTSGQVLTSGGAGANPSWQTPSSAGDHALLSNLTWTASGHTGTASRLAGFSGAGATAYYQIGVDVQAYNANLAAIAGLTSAANKLPYFTGSGTAGVADFTPAGFSLTLSANATIGGTNTGDQTLNSLLPSQAGNSGKFLTTDATNASWATVSSSSGANPSASVGLTAVNGSASTFLRSDGAPALSQSIAPTWTGIHTFARTATTGAAGSDFVITVPAHTTLTASTERIAVNINASSTKQFATGALTTQREVVIQAPTYSFVGASTITKAATVEITGAPVAGTNATITTSMAMRIIRPTSSMEAIRIENTTSNNADVVVAYNEAAIVVCRMRGTGRFDCSSGYELAGNAMLTSPDSGATLIFGGTPTTTIRLTAGGNTRTEVTRDTSSGEGVAYTFSTISSTSTVRPQARDLSQWSVNTDASRAGRIIKSVYYITTAQEYMRANAASTGVVLTLGNDANWDGLIVNENGEDADVRMEGDTDANLLFVDASADRVGIGTNSPGSKLDVAGSLQCDSITNDTGLAHGTYTPTLTNVANLDGSTAFECQYMRVGNTVTVSGKVSVDPTLTATSTQLGISLPVASNLGAEEDCAGVAFASGIAMLGAAILGDATNNRAQMQWVSSDVTDQPMYFSFSYQII